MLHARSMSNNEQLLKAATDYHEALPPRLREYLNHRGIPDVLIDFHLLGWNGARISIPIFDREGQLAFFKFAKSPDDESDSPKMLATSGAKAELYGWEEVLYRPDDIVICEGEFDRLALKAQGFRAVTSTGGARVFRDAWAGEFAPIGNVYICFDRDAAGREGALHVGRLIPQAKIIELPEEVGEGGDVTDFFVRLGRTDEDFRALFEQAMPAPPAPPNERPEREQHHTDTPLRQRIERLKHIASIETVIGRYVDLKNSGSALVGTCPFHQDQIPSLTVYPETQTFYCFGCGAHGDVISFLREIEGLRFFEALDMLEALAMRDEGKRREGK
jgi:DNA primase